MKTSVALARGGKLFQQILNALRQVGDAARGSAVGELRVRPQRAQHLDQVRLARAIESAHPDGRLLSLIDVLQIGLDDVRKAFLVLAIADKGLQLVPEDRKCLIGAFVVNVGHAFVDEFPRRRVLGIDLSVVHHALLYQASMSAVIGTAR